MSATRMLHPLPAPVVHAGFSVSQSKSTVLAGVQDAYWSDDEGEDADCPLCLEEMDISDLNFKPCMCGYQICRFCWHHIKENLNGRCPACRRTYTDDAVEFKPIDKEDHKRLTQQKKQKERERKELDALGRRHLANVRVVQRNVVYVVGIAARFAKEELIPTLRSNEFFGQYGKITKMLLVKRTPSGGAPVVGLYITYQRREDAARCIAAVDGTAPQGGGRDDVMRASHGTTKYCMSFLRGATCNDHSCMNLHEWGDEKDCFTKEDLTTLKHTMKATERRARETITIKKGEETDGLPRGASWGQKSASSASTATSALSAARQPRRVTTTLSSTTRPTRPALSSASESRTSTRSTPKLTSTTSKTSTVSSRPSTPASSSLPPKPAEASLPPKPVVPEVKALKKKEKEIPTTTVSSPAPSTAADSDVGSTRPTSPVAAPPAPAPAPAPAPEVTTPDRAKSPDAPPAVPPGLPAAPPGLSAPPGLGPPPGLSAPPGLFRQGPTRVDTASPQTPLLASQTSYQMSDAARALLDDVQARRHLRQPTIPAISPFPDFDRTLNSLGDSGGFSFSLDPKLATEDGTDLPELNNVIPPYPGTFLDAFPGLRGDTASPVSIPSRLGYGSTSNRNLYTPSSAEIGSKEPDYHGSFDPFADVGEDKKSGSRALGEEEGTRQVSRFGFAQRGRRGSSTTTTTAASPALHTATSTHHLPPVPPLPPNALNGLHTDTSQQQQQQLYSSDSSTHYNRPPRHDVSPFNVQPQQQSYSPAPAKSSPLVQQAHAQALYAQQQQQQQQQHRYQQTYDSSVSEAQLRDLIQASRARGGITDMHDSQLYKMSMSQSHQQFNDPAIMSARFGSPMTHPPGLNYPNMETQHTMNQMSYGPPPGIGYQHYNNATNNNANVYTQMHTQQGQSSTEQQNASNEMHTHTHASVSPSSPADPLSPSEFPALSAAAEPTASPAIAGSTSASSIAEKQPSPSEVKAQELAEKRAAKRAATAERQAERQRVAREKAEAKAAEKARAAQEKAAEKEKLASSEKAAKEKAAQEKAEKERVAKEKAEKAKKEREAEVAEKERLAKIEKERLAAKAEKEKEAAAKKAKAASAGKQKSLTPAAATEPTSPPAQEALLSKKPKKYKPAVVKPVRLPREDDHADNNTVSPAEAASVLPPRGRSNQSSSNNSRAESVDDSNDPTSVEELLEEIEMLNPAMDLLNHPFFDVQKINAAIKMPLEYGPLVHALSALSVGGGSFANNLPSGSIDNAVSSFQQLLETLTQTISDLLRLLPRTTWDDSSSFDGVLRDMLKGDDFLDDGGEENQGKDDEVATLTLALERRARWMEVQLSKLEELHRDINTAAVRAVLSFNDNGWDRHGLLPCVGDTLKRFDNIALKKENGVMRPMTADELEQKLVVAKEVVQFTETELREQMEYMLDIRPMDID